MILVSIYASAQKKHESTEVAMQTSLKRLSFVPLCFAALLLAVSCAPTSTQQANTTAPAQAKQQSAEQGVQTATGTIKGISNLAKSISLEVGSGEAAKTMLIRFDDKTKGMQDAIQGEPSIITYTMQGDTPYATELKRKIASIPEGVAEIKTAELVALLGKDPKVFLVDSRPAARYNQAHLPGAHSIPQAKLEKEKTKVLPADKNTPLVFYCGGVTCPFSPASATIAKDLGYTNVMVYHEGEPEWTKAGLPAYSDDDYIVNGNVVVIDLRDPQSAQQGRIKGAYNISYEQLFDKLDDVARNAPLVLYDTQEPEEVVAELREEGFKFVSLVKDGYTGWMKRGGAIEKGPIYANEIRWVRQLGKGEVSLEDFRKAASGEDKNAIIVDARSKEEVAQLGTFKNTINMPLDEIPQRLNELPKDKKIYVHCATGARADMAYNELIKHGFDAKFLLLNIEDAACDCEIIRP